MSNDNPSTPATPKSALDLLKDWKELITFVALTLTSALNGVFGGVHPTLQKGSWILAVVFVALGAYVVHRKHKRKLEQERREKIWAESEAQRKAGSAFRSLAPFEERDKLPGKDRKVEARAIATRIASDDFRFGAVCGDTGCGKTSMLRSEVTSVLQASGFDTAYVRNPRRLESKTSEALPTTERLASELRALAKNYIKPTTAVVILDQFEEWFIEYQQPEHRVQIGKFIRKLAERPGRIRIVCAIRREFLIDFQDLSDELPQQLSTTNLFHIKNFTVDQAKDVINECATADGLAPDESFAETAAHDLAEEGQARPPELQIVCTYLAVSGGLNTPKYRQAGGTAGILAHYIQDALDASKDRAIAARVLRALCDFPAHARRKGRTIDELTDDINTDGSALRETVEGLARNFVLGRILTEERGENGDAFSLIHDYLVDAIQLATSDDSTKTEEANQLLKFYVAEKRGTIPFRKLRFIKRFAERRQLENPLARRLLRRSVTVPILWQGMTVLAAIILASGFFLFSTAGIQWQTKTVGRHWVGEKSGPVGLFPMLANNKVLGISDLLEDQFSFWELRTGRPLGRFDNPNKTVHKPLKPTGRFSNRSDQPPEIVESASGKFMLVNYEDYPLKKRGLLFDLSLMSIEVLPEGAHHLHFSDEGNWLAWVEDVRQVGDTGSQLAQLASLPPPPRLQLVIYFLQTHTKTKIPIPNGFLDYRLTEKGNGFVAFAYYNSNVIDMYEIAYSRLFPLGIQDERYGHIIAVALTSSQLCTILRLPSNEDLVSLWSFENGQPPKEYVLPLEADLDSGAKVNFSQDASRILVYKQEEDKPLAILNASDLKPVEQVPKGVSLGFAYAYTLRTPLVYWEERDGTRIWDPTAGTSRKVQGLKIAEDENLVVADGIDRALTRHDQVVELWDIANSKLVKTLFHSKVVQSASFTIGEEGVVLYQAGGVFSLYDSVDGVLIASELTSDPSNVIYFDRTCRRFLLWTWDGEIVRYAEGRKYFWKFVPSRRCE